ncbi:MAG: aldehyde dehydrogenase [Pseudomonadota bacterium]
MRQIPMHIGGAPCEATDGRWIESFDPSTEAPWSQVPRGDYRDATLAVDAAHHAFHAGPWATMTATRRGGLLRALALLLERDQELLVGLDLQDNGKPITELRKQYAYLPELWTYFAGLADKIESDVIPVDRTGVFNFTQREPVGVVVAITPWNSPLSIASWKIAPALAAGCTTIVKPSEHASASTLHLAALATEAGFPDGVVNVVTGYGAEIGLPLIADARVAKISFTGGDAGGRAVYETAARHLKPVVMELGGKSPVLVFDDADLARAVPSVLGGIFSSSGQSCVAGSRLLLQAGIHDAFMAALVEQAAALHVGDPRDPATHMGPVSTQQQYTSVLRKIGVATQEGAVPTAASQARQLPAQGWFVPPTIFTGVGTETDLWREEVFGPVLAVRAFDTEAEALYLANDSRFGLAAGVWTRDLGRALRLSQAIQAGTVWVNSYRGVSSMTPLGGYKQSGFGRENGRDAVGEYLQVKSVWMEYQ